MTQETRFNFPDGSAYVLRGDRIGDSIIGELAHQAMYLIWEQEQALRAKNKYFSDPCLPRDQKVAILEKLGGVIKV